MLGVDSGEIYPDTECRAQLLVQGIIDVYFEEEDGLVVLDYKTDRVRTADELVRDTSHSLHTMPAPCHRLQERQSKKRSFIHLLLERKSTFKWKVMY